MSNRKLLSAERRSKARFVFDLQPALIALRLLRDTEVTLYGSPLSMRKKVRIMVALTLLAWATQLLFHQWGYGQAMPIEGQPKFVPQPLTAGAGTMEFRNDATVHGAEIKLKQLCRWSDGDANAFAPVAELVVARFEKEKAYRTVTLEEIRATLRDAGVNLAVIRFAGTTGCTVTRSDVPGGDRAGLQQWIEEHGGTVAAAVPNTRPASLAGNTTADTSPIKTLRAQLLSDLSQRLNLSIEQLQVSFDPKDTNLLNLAEPGFAFDIQPRRVRDLGEVAWSISILTDGRGPQQRQKVTVTANARAWQQQIVLARPLSYRGVIREDDVTERRVLIDHIDPMPVLSRPQVVGQQAARDLQTGTVMTARCVEAVALAKAGQYVTVMLTQGSVQLKTVAKALEPGSFGQSIRVKNEATRDIFEVTLTGPQTATMGAVKPEAGLASMKQ